MSYMFFVVAAILTIIATLFVKNCVIWTVQSIAGHHHR